MMIPFAGAAVARRIGDFIHTLGPIAFDLVIGYFFHAPDLVFGELQSGACRYWVTGSSLFGAEVVTVFGAILKTNESHAQYRRVIIKSDRLT